MKFFIAAASTSVCLIIALFSLAINHESPAFNKEGVHAYCAQHIESFIEEKGSMVNCDAREWYNDTINTILEVDFHLISVEASEQERARCAYQIRHQARVSARNDMESAISMASARVYDLLKYSDFDGPKFEYFTEDKKMSYADIIKSAQRTNSNVNGLCTD